MLMTDGEIKQALESGELKIGSYDPRRLEPCSYDARAGNEVLTSRIGPLVNLATANSVTLQAGDFALIMTFESFTLPLDMAGHIGMKSVLARRGLILLAGIQIDPGFDGFLRLGLYNSSGRPITVDYLDTICTIEFHRLNRPVEKAIAAFPDLKEGRIPGPDKAYLRELESTSLSDLSKDLRSLSQSVHTLTTVTYKFIMPLLIAMAVGIFIPLTIQLFIKACSTAPH